MASIILRVALFFPLLFPAATSFSIIDAPPHAPSQNLAFANQLGSVAANISCFGDGYCCCEGCPPGNCPSIFISAETGTLKTQPGPGTIESPCSTDGYCCCEGCPPGTCTLSNVDPAVAAIPASTEQTILDAESSPDTTPPSDRTSLCNCGINCPPRVCGQPSNFIALPREDDLRTCCLSGTCPPGVCGSRLVTFLPELTVLAPCCQSGSCPPGVCGSLFKAFRPDFLELTNCCKSGSCPPCVCGGSCVDVKVPAEPSDLRNCCLSGRCPPGVCGGHFAVPTLAEQSYIPIIVLTKATKPQPVTIWAQISAHLTHSFISLDLVGKLDRQSDRYSIPNGGSHVADINGLHIPITKALNLTVIAGKSNNYVANQTFEVFDAGQADEKVPDVILGTDFLTNAGALALTQEFQDGPVKGIPVLVPHPASLPSQQQGHSEL